MLILKYRVKVLTEMFGRSVRTAHMFTTSARAFCAAINFMGNVDKKR